MSKENIKHGSIIVKFTLIVILVVAATVSIIAFYGYSQSREMIMSSEREALEDNVDFAIDSLTGASAIAFEESDYQGDAINHLYDLTDEMIIDRVVGSSGVLYGVNNEGEIRFHTDENMRGEHVSDTFMNELADKNEEFEYIEDETRYLVSFRPWDDMYVIGRINLDEIQSQVSNVRTVSMLIAAAGIIVSTGALVMIFKTSINSPIKKLQDQMNLLENGDLKANFDHKKNDEMGLISKAFNTAVSELKNMINHIQEKIQSILGKSQQIDSNVKQTIDSINQTSSAVNEIANGATDQADDIANSMEKLDDLSSLIDKSTENSKEAGYSIDEIKESIDNLGTEFNDLKGNFEENKNFFTKLENNISTLQEESKSIEEIVNDIKEISDQTNLLALNASIESARAGEHGEGFAVVADEVRTLAENSVESTEKIESIIKSIKENIESTNETTESNKEKIDKAETSIFQVEEVFEKTKEYLGNVISKLETLNDNISKISDTKEDVYQKFQDISAVTEETTASVEEVSASFEEQVSTLESVGEEIESLRKEIETITDYLDSNFST
ncbi:methyl-accepting chemotaxis protein [Natranaerofaba carboxydovora]|uniref:methyl-accepting chemotaxis protein n=1 Tax=Natranaerofaba carboxydovora TaxID=2742683 RepID=UPI001F13B424|nr:methyl-accepting chemotaxis protein [Natranaerofaba carboxydovora]UMZ73519.1 Methyl-accepting chemotaxis protein McpC [Natranaerofaba carboxydovora]